MIFDLKIAITDKLKELYPSATIYDEDIPQGFKDGSFFIEIIEPSFSKAINNQYKAAVMVDLIYFPIDQSIKNNECYQVAENIFRSIDLISGYRIGSKTAEVTDDVLHIKFKVSSREIKADSQTKMKDISYK